MFYKRLSKVIIISAVGIFLNINFAQADATFTCKGQTYSCVENYNWDSDVKGCRDDHKFGYRCLWVSPYTGQGQKSDVCNEDAKVFNSTSTLRDICNVEENK